MTKVSVVIPYYQREPGILRRALSSVYAQDLGIDVRVEVLVVDDASPSRPEPEIVGLERSGFSIRVLERPNGGPAKARNTGLDGAGDADFIAFLDSDDAWMPSHLDAALRALRGGSAFYFADNYYDGELTWFAGLACTPRLLAAAKEERPDEYRISSTALMPFFLEECLAHTSTVVFDARRVPNVRFDEELAKAGEDYLFWLSVASKVEFVSFSLKPMASRGRGVDLYRGALDWDRPECIQRLFYALMLHKKIATQFCTTPLARRVLTGKIEKLRRGILYLLARNAAAHVRSNAWVVRELVRRDPGFWPSLPRNAYITVSSKLAGKLDFPVG